MQILKKILVFVLLSAIALFIGIWIYFNSLKPSYQGTIQLKNIDTETSVFFDDFGIPHIYATSQKDAFTALGYVHAQDRLFQMELLKRIAPGRLSEIFGKSMLKNDMFFATLGIEEISKKSIEKIDKNSKAYTLSMAYLNGVNQFINNGPTPIEYTLIGIKKEEFTLIDIYNIFGYMSFSFAMAQKTDPLLSAIEQKLGLPYLNELAIDVDTKTTLIKNYKNGTQHLESMVAQVNTVLENSPIPPFIGSNSWVVSPKKTTTGHVLFANDPHIGYSQPSVWYEAHITTPTYEMYGYHLAGVPFPLLGHNRNFAYGLTMFENDDIDFYQEENNPKNENEYKNSNEYNTYKITKKTIKVKDSANVVLNIKATHHGPIINQVIDGVTQNQPIAMSWIFTKFDIKSLEALYTISHAKNKDDVKKGASLIHAPGLNIMYGDAAGNIAWWAAGKLYKLKSNSNRKTILNGNSGSDEIANYIDFNENPMAENPEWNYVYSANNQPDTISNILYPGYYLPEDRAKRIVQLLSAKNNWSKAAFSEMINDNTSAVAQEIVKKFTSLINYNHLTKTEQQAFDILQLWDGSNTKESIAPTIYNKLIYNYLKNTFEDELGENLFNQLNKTHLIKREIAHQLFKEKSIWWDNVNTANSTETREAILLKSFKETIHQLKKQLGNNILQWNWGKVHTLEHPHPIGTVSYLKKYFNVGPFPMNGAREVIDNRGYELNNKGIYNITAGPSTRRIIDFSDIENSISILPTGQSGNPFSKHFKDQAEMSNKGAFRKMKMNKKEIISTSTKLTILPKNE